MLSTSSCNSTTSRLEFSTGSINSGEESLGQQTCTSWPIMTILVYRDGRDLGRGEFPFIHYRQTCTDGIGEALRANWLRSGAFLSPPDPSPPNHWPPTTHYWPLFACHRPLFSCSTLHAPHLTLHAPPAGSGRAQTLPRWPLPSTNRRIDKDRTGPDLDERPVSIQYVTELGDCCGKINPFLPDSLRTNR